MSVKLEPWAIALIAVGGTIVLGSSIVFAIDWANVFWFVRYYHRPQADPAKVAAYRKKMEDAYYDRTDAEDGKEENPFRHKVTDEEFEQNIRDFEAEMDKKGATPNGTIFSSLDDAYMKLLRESIGVVIAPRAVLFQVAHPYVAIGIKQHSNVVRDTPKRFDKTYFHMFRMAFGTRAQAIKSARLLRKTHNRVFGQFDENVGNAFKHGHNYTAAHTHALLWVGLALAESVTYGYEMMVGRFTKKEREQLAQDAAYGMMLFGLPKKIATGSYDEFRIAIEACWTSEIVTVSESAKEIAHHLLYPTKWYLKPIFCFARYFTRVIMPERYQLEFFGKKATFFDQIFVSFVGAIMRFTYRLIPGPLRYIPEYSAAVRRNGSRTTWWLCDPCARLLEAIMLGIKPIFMAFVLPTPKNDLEERDTDKVVIDGEGVGDTMPKPQQEVTLSAYQVQEKKLDA